MSIFVTCLSSASLEEMRAKIADAKERYPDILKYFWISEGRQAAQFDRQDAATRRVARAAVTKKHKCQKL
jgi:hypothetical protein